MARPLPAPSGGPVLALVLTPRYVGRAASPDLARQRPDDIGTWDIREHITIENKIAVVRERTGRLLEALAPRVVVLGIPMRDDPGCRALRREIAEQLGQRAVPFVVRRVATARWALLGRFRGEAPGALAERLAADYFPALKGLRDGGPEIDRYRRNAWSALAIVTAELLAGLRRREAAAPADIPEPTPFAGPIPSPT